MNRHSFSATLMIAINQLQYSLDLKNDPVAYRLYNELQNCNDERQIINVLIQGLKAYSDRFDVVKTTQVYDYRNTDVKILLNEDQIQKIK